MSVDHRAGPAAWTCSSLVPAVPASGRFPRAFGLGLIVYGVGSFVTGLAPNLATLLLGWSLPEGVGAALIMPAIVSLVASNFPPERRSAAYGLVAAAGAMAVAVGFPKLRPGADPRRTVRIGLGAMITGILILTAGWTQVPTRASWRYRCC